MEIGAIRERASVLAAEAVETRRYLHAHPEVSWREVETSRFIEAKLRELGLENIRRGFGGTECGVVADLIGGAPGPCVALRADIDALPLEEENTFAHRSCRAGAMHACGHDGHMAALLGAARLLSERRAEIAGRVRFLFQPAEEHGRRSGAREMVAEGVLDGVDAIGGMHLWTFVPTGRVLWRNGPIMASSDGWSATFTGRGGHGAMPHQAVDPTVAAAAFIGALQTIASREIDPTEAVVVSLGKLNAGEAFNIIPNTVDLLGTIRTFNAEVRGGIEERIRRIAEGIAAAYRCTAHVELDYMYPSVVNHPGATALLREVAEAVVGADEVRESPLWTVSEDFSYYLEKIPGTFFFVGCGNGEKGTDYPHHSPRFDVDEDALPTAIALLSAYAFSMLERLRAGAI